MPDAPIETPEALRSLLVDLEDVSELAFDVEGDGLFRYRARLCTVQIATRDRIAVVDTLALSAHLDELQPLLDAAGPLKVIHDASFDARLLRDVGVDLGHVFDTAIAARFLGEEGTGLATLLEKHFDVSVPKGQQQADWGKRPLNEEDLHYLENDVRHLLELGDRMAAQVRAAGIEAEVAEECAYMLEGARGEEPDERPPWMRIKGRDSLDGPGRAILREAAAVREREAERRDVPPFKVVNNSALLELARRRPRSGRELGRIRGLGRGRARLLAGALLEAVRAGEAAGDVPEEERPDRRREDVPPPEERAARKRRQKALTKWRRREAEARGVDVQVVLPGHCLQDLSSQAPEDVDGLHAIPGLGGARIERYGEALLDLVAAADG